MVRCTCIVAARGLQPVLPSWLGREPATKMLKGEDGVDKEIRKYSKHQRQEKQPNTEQRSFGRRKPAGRGWPVEGWGLVILQPGKQGRHPDWQASSKRKACVIIGGKPEKRKEETEKRPIKRGSDHSDGGNQLEGADLSMAKDWSPCSRKGRDATQTGRRLSTVRPAASPKTTNRSKIDKQRRQ